MSEPSSNILAGRRLFVIEDNAFDVAVVTKVLTLQGAQVFAAQAHLDSHAQVLLNLPLDLILLDLQLRGCDGYAVLTHLQHDARTRLIPVVMVTIHDPAREIPRAQAAGCAGYISKPIDALTFARDIADIISGHHKWIISRS